MLFVIVGGWRRYVLVSGGDDGALAGHCIDVSIKCRVVARGRRTLAHAAQITGDRPPTMPCHVMPCRPVLSAALYCDNIEISSVSVCVLPVTLSHEGPQHQQQQQQHVAHITLHQILRCTRARLYCAADERGQTLTLSDLQCVTFAKFCRKCKSASQ